MAIPGPGEWFDITDPIKAITELREAYEEQHRELQKENRHLHFVGKLWGRACEKAKKHIGKHGLGLPGDNIFTTIIEDNERLRAERIDSWLDAENGWTARDHWRDKARELKIDNALLRAERDAAVELAEIRMSEIVALRRHLQPLRGSLVRLSG